MNDQEKTKVKKMQVSDQISKLISEQKRRNRKSGYIFFGYFIVVLLLSYLIPEDVLTKNPNLEAIVNWAGQLIPSIHNFGEVSPFSQVAKLVFMLEVISLPILMWISISIIGPPKELNIFKRLAVVSVLIFVAYKYFIWMPGDGLGHGFSSRLFSSMINSKFFFASWTSAFTVALSVLVSGTWKNILRN